jgi:Integrase core domain
MSGAQSSRHMVATTQKGGLTPQQMIDRATVSAPVTSQELTYKDRQGFTTNTDRTHALAPWRRIYNTGRRHSALGSATLNIRRS